MEDTPGLKENLVMHYAFYLARTVNDVNATDVGNR
jgi:hypothetical protein